jgi:YD repeat-containing protein
MKKLLLLAVLLVGAGFFSQARAQQIYDTEGHLIAYQYPDGKRDLYTYDSSWRLVKFTSRDGAVTQYRYDDAGGMQVVSGQ